MTPAERPQTDVSKRAARRQEHTRRCERTSGGWGDRSTWLRCSTVARGAVSRWRQRGLRGAVDPEHSAVLADEAGGFEWRDAGGFGEHGLAGPPLDLEAQPLAGLPPASKSAQAGDERGVIGVGVGIGTAFFH